MPEYLAPSVYIEEEDAGNQPIEGVATSTAGFLGITERGPTAPTLVTSFSGYARVFGRYVEGSFLAHAVEGFFQNGGQRCFIQRVVSHDDSTAAATATLGGMQVHALGSGAWANGRVALKVTRGGDDAPDFKLIVLYWDAHVDLPDTVVDPSDPANIADENRRDPTLTEVYENLSPNPTSANFYQRRVNGFSNLIEVEQIDDDAPEPLDKLVFLHSGSDGAAITLADFRGDPTDEVGQKTGLDALAAVNEIAILCCPEEGIPAFAPIGGDVVTQCERLKDRFAIIQAPRAAPPVATHWPSHASKYAAYYYPWLKIRHPRSGEEMLVPPGGHVAGIYARTDIERGVHHAPANELIRGLSVDSLDLASGLQLHISRSQQDILNPRGVNVLSHFPGRGDLVWGARTTIPDPDWKYVNVRRLFIFVEESIEEATQWAVFEPNDEPLWARLRRAVNAFLRRLWMDGMLQGATAGQAYFVKCDRTTMTQADIDNGRLIMLVGIAPVKPAEFVIFRIGKWTGGSEVREL